MNQQKKSRLQTDYKIKRLLGSGAYGVVLEVENILDKQSYAIKVSGYDGGQALREVENLVKVPVHPNVVHYHTCWKDVFQKSELSDLTSSLRLSPGNDQFTVGAGKTEVAVLCIQMELCKEDLRKWMARQGTVDEPLVVNIFIQIAQGLQHIHKYNIIHRDLKPENIFLSTNASLQVKIGDLGIATAHNSTNSAAHTASMGTPLYLAPEQGTSRYGKPADLYALGLILFELFSPQLQPRRCNGLFHKLYQSFVDLKYSRVMPSELESQWPKVADLILNLLMVEPERRPTFQKIYNTFNAPPPPAQRILEERLKKLVVQQDKVEPPKLNRWGNFVANSQKVDKEKDKLPSVTVTQKAMYGSKMSCKGCSKTITGMHAVVGQNPWHTECFKCCHCFKVIENHFPHNGKYYCPDDYYKLFSLRCEYCKLPCREKYTKALGKFYHPEHFKCYTCGKTLHEQKHFQKDDKPYCVDDYHKLFSPRCASCNEPCKQESYWHAMGKNWHPEHFNCFGCGVNLHKMSFFNISGRACCVKCQNLKK